MTISGPHAFDIICITKLLDTDSTTTISPLSGYPTITPTTSTPTEAEYPVFNVSFNTISGSAFLSDPYGRYEGSSYVTIYDEEALIQIASFPTVNL